MSKAGASFWRRPRCEAEVVHGNAIVANFDQCSRFATTMRLFRIGDREYNRPVCTQHAKAYDRKSMMWTEP